MNSNAKTRLSGVLAQLSVSPKSILPMLSILLVAMTTTGLSTAWAQTDPWTTVGSAGTVDEADTGIVLLGSPNAGSVTMPAAATGTLNVRYNVVAVDGALGGDNYALTARFRDNGANGRVIVRLKRYNLNTGVVTTLLTLDSNAFVGLDSFQTRTVTSACGTSLDFFNNAYFMDVEIIKTAAAGTPALGSIKLGLSLC